MSDWWKWRRSFQGELERLSDDELQAYAVRCDGEMNTAHDRWLLQKSVFEMARGDFHAAVNAMNRIGLQHSQLMEERAAILREEGRRRGIIKDQS